MRIRRSHRQRWNPSNITFRESVVSSRTKNQDISNGFDKPTAETGMSRTALFPAEGEHEQSGDQKMDESLSALRGSPIDRRRVAKDIPAQVGRCQEMLKRCPQTVVGESQSRFRLVHSFNAVAHTTEKRSLQRRCGLPKLRHARRLKAPQK